MSETKLSKNDLRMYAKSTIMEFIRSISQVFRKQEEQGDLFLVEFFFDKLSEAMIMDKIVKEMLPWEQYIADRDSKFFIENRTIFSAIPPDRRDYFSGLWDTDPRLTAEVKDVIWSYLDTLIELARGYKKFS